MRARTDSRIDALKKYVEDTHQLCRQLNTAEDNELLADDANARIANPEKGDDVPYLKKFLAGRGDIRVLRSRHIHAKLRFQLHLAKGRPIKQAALNSVRELLLDAAGGEASLTTSPIGPLAQCYMTEIQKARAWPTAAATLQQLNLHLSEVWKAVERAVSESDLIRRERKDPAPWLVQKFEAS